MTIRIQPPEATTVCVFGHGGLIGHAESAEALAHLGRTVGAGIARPDLFTQRQVDRCAAAALAELSQVRQIVEEG